MYDRPWGAAELSAPELCEVDFPAVLVREAVHPGDGALLAVTLAPGQAGPERQTIALRGLDLTRPLCVTVDGVDVTLSPDQHQAFANDLGLRADRVAILLRLKLMLWGDRRITIR
jgi:hypothetical protein